MKRHLTSFLVPIKHAKFNKITLVRRVLINIQLRVAEQKL